MSKVRWFYLVAAGIIISVCGFDVWLVQTGHTSISLMTWLIERLHPTAIIGVLGIGLFVAGAIYFNADKDYYAFSLITFVLLATGHLVTSEGASIAMGKAKNWHLTSGK